jgi:fatty-acid desaturase
MVLSNKSFVSSDPSTFMAFIDIVLKEPSYGWAHPNGDLVKPTSSQIWREFFSRINVFKSRKNWLPFMGWAMIVGMIAFPVLFFTKFFNPWLIPVMIIYAMLVMGTHGTIWYHRYGTHKSYTFSHPFWRVFTQNLVIRTLPEEVYIVSHHVHHAKSDLPGDPYNARAGLLYCMLADANHQGINTDLSEKEYGIVTKMMSHSGVRLNTYKQYQKWGSATNVWYAVSSWLINWVFWYSVLYLLGGHALATALFSGALLWFVGVRAFNFTGHGKGEEMHQDGIDLDRSNLAINQLRPGLIAGEWHNNHHLFPASARSGFLPWQIDNAWIYIYVMHKLGAVSKYHSSKAEFMKKYEEAVQKLNLQDAHKEKAKEVAHGKLMRDGQPA